MAEDDLGNGVDHRTVFGLVMLVLVVALSLGIPTAIWAMMLRNEVGKCDAAVMVTLKAPATYHRVTSMWDAGSLGDSYTLEYDAENSFGVPLRGKGRCTMKPDGTASWFEISR